MVEIKEYQKWIEIYLAQMRKIIEESGISVPDSLSNNMSALTRIMIDENLLINYPTLKKVLHVLWDGRTSYKSKINAMKNNISDAFKKSKFEVDNYI